MEFKQMRTLMQKHFADLSKDAQSMFEVEVDKDEMWNLYLDSFPEGTNNIFRERRSHDCSCCRHFIKSIGNAVFIKDNQIYTIWGFKADETYQPVLDALDVYIKAHAVTDVYVTHDHSVGTDSNFEEIVGGKPIKWDHFHLILPNALVDRSRKSIGEIKGDYRATKQVFKRSLDEITMDALDTVMELIASNSLYRGIEWKAMLSEFIKYKKDYDQLPEELKDNFAWEQSVKVGPSIGRIRNHSIGTLLTDISEGKDLDMAVRSFEQMVAPANYKRPQAIFTKKMLEDAQKTVQELGYMDSLARRFATLDDITINNILFSNADAKSRMNSTGDIFAEMATKVSAVDPKRFSKAGEISIEKFVSDVLPTARELEVLVENRHIKNFVSLLAPKNLSAPSMFKWNNPFSWAYTGNMTDSDIKQNVAKAGGDVTGVLRFSIQWNDEDVYNQCDYDAHCYTPDEGHIYFGAKHDLLSGGVLDVDITAPRKDVAAVENITWANKAQMKPGKYQFGVHCWAARSGNSGFRAEIEFDGNLYQFEYPRNIHNRNMILIATITLDKNGNFSIDEHLTSNGRSVKTKNAWGIQTNNFVPVTVVMYSPNYWDEQQGIGNLHYMFMLKDCVNQERPNAFYNEFLHNDLMKHKRVFEALGNKLAVEDVEDQLSGLGFSSTQRNDIVVRVKGSVEQIIRVKF